MAAIAPSAVQLHLLRVPLHPLASRFAPCGLRVQELAVVAAPPCRLDLHPLGFCLLPGRSHRRLVRNRQTLFVRIVFFY